MSVLDVAPGDYQQLIDQGWDPEEAAKHTQVEEEMSSEPVRSSGQVRMAEIFVHENSPYLRYVHGLNWYLWTGCYWKADEERADIRAAIATLKNALARLPSMHGEERDVLYKNVKRMENANSMEGMLRIARAMRPISTPAKSLDSDPYLFNTANGTLNLKTGLVTEPFRDDLITKAAGGVIEDSGSTGEWEKFVERVLPDPAVRSYVQRLVGYAMLGKVTEHIMPIFTGTGANGKGTFRDTLMAAFGDYAIEVDPALLMESKHERHGSFKMRLRGARLVFCSETEKGRKFAEATMKRLVGGDPIEANLMHQNPITFDPSHLLIMLTNHLPIVSGDDPAVWRRISVVPWDVVIPVHERDPLLPEKLKGEKSSVLSWVYQGWLEYQQQGLNPPDAVVKRTQEYRYDSDVLKRFLDDMTMATSSGVVKARKLFEVWSRWCASSGEEAGSEKAFATSLELRGLSKRRTAGGQVYQGLVLLDGDDQEER